MCEMWSGLKWFRIYRRWRLF